MSAANHSKGSALEHLAAKAATLRALHHKRHPLVLPNVWDVASARLVEAASFPVIATSSGAVAAALGYPDNDSIPPDEAFAAITRISNNVSIPVTADIEAGYRLEPEELMACLLGTGAVGCNLEDTDHHGGGPLIDIKEHSERLAAVRAAAKSAGVDLVINARVDVALGDEALAASRFEEAIDRAKSYLAAGADCVYPIRLQDEHHIGEFVQRVQAPVNIMLGKESPALPRLVELGVSRVSLAGGLMRRAYSVLRQALDELRASVPDADH